MIYLSKESWEAHSGGKWEGVEVTLDQSDMAQLFEELGSNVDYATLSQRFLIANLKCRQIVAVEKLMRGYSTQAQTTVELQGIKTQMASIISQLPDPQTVAAVFENVAAQAESIWDAVPNEVKTTLAKPKPKAKAKAQYE